MIPIVNIVQFEQVCVGIVMSDQEAVLLSPQPALMGGEQGAPALFVELEGDAIALLHVGFQRKALLPEQGEGLCVHVCGDGRRGQRIDHGSRSKEGEELVWGVLDDALVDKAAAYGRHFYGRA